MRRSGQGWRNLSTMSTCVRFPARRLSLLRCRQVPAIPSRRPAWMRAAAVASPGQGPRGRACPSAFVDTGLIPNASEDHPWLSGVRGAEENPYGADGTIVPYGGHGTFVAGVLRCIAPKATVYVERAFDIAGADYETRLASSLADALDQDPDIMVFTFTTSTHRDSSLHTFDDFYERRLQSQEGTGRARAPATTAGHAGCRPPRIPA